MFNCLRASVAIHRNNNGQADAYGASIKLNGEAYAFASVYLDTPVSVNECVRQALEYVVSVRRFDGEGIVVHGACAPFRYFKMQSRVIGETVCARLHLFHAENLPEETRKLAEDAVTRETTITEKL